MLSLADAFDHVRELRLRELLHHWLDGRTRAPAGWGCPPVSAMDPLKFPGALSVVWLCDVASPEARHRFRYRLVGDHIRDAYGRHIVGQTLEELTPTAALPRIRGYFDQAADVPAVVHVIGRVYAEALRPARGERLILPYIDTTAQRVTRILGATVHSWVEPNVPIGAVPDRQIRTFTPTDGRDAWSESWL